MSFCIIPHEIVILFTKFMNVYTFSVFRYVYRLNWTFEKIKQYGTMNIKKIEDKCSRIPEYTTTMSFQNIYFSKCVECKQQCVSFIEWKTGHKRLSLPWCALHVPDTIMERVECFCIFKTHKTPLSQYFETLEYI